MRRYLSALLLLIICALGCVLGYLWLDQDGNLRNIHWTAPSPLKPEIPSWPISLQSASNDTNAFLNVLERPLFSPSRRPPPPPPPPVAPPPPDPLQGAQILGVFGSGDRGGILVMIEGRLRRVAKGDQVGEWLLKAVSDRDATFERKGEVRVIRISNAKLNSASGAPPIFQAAPPPPRPVEVAPSIVTAPLPSNATAAPPPKAGGAVFGGGAVKPVAPAAR